MSLPVASSTREIWFENLTGEMLLFGLLSKLLYANLDQGFLQSLLDHEVFSESPFANDEPDVQEGLRLLQGWAQANQPVLSQTAFDDLRADMTRLFAGLSRVKVPQWESVYFGKNRLVFQEQTSQVRKWYLRFGLQAENPYAEPDDHIGLELAFLAHLAKLGLQQLEESEDLAGFEQLLQAQKQFLQEHLLTWVFQWEGLLRKHARTDFYQGLALLTGGAVRHLASLLAIPIKGEAGQ